MRQILAGQPRPPRSVVRGIPRPLDAIVRQALARDAGGRYPTAQALAADLLRFTNGEPVHTPQPGFFARALATIGKTPGASRGEIPGGQGPAAGR